MQMLQEPVFRRTTATEIARIDFAAFSQSVGLAFNQIATNADVLGGIQRAVACPGPVLTQVLVGYEGREMRWLGALRSQYIKKLPNNQKIRMAARIGVRTVSRQPDSD
jgi:acetolactate synthase-1/2/3 large subunit